MKKVAIVVGHSARSPGAVNKSTGKSEYEFNRNLAGRINFILDDSSIVKPIIVYRDTYSGLPDKINALEPDFIFSLHCNAFDTKTSGTETLYYHKSNRGEQLAEIVQSHIENALDLRDRGIIPVDSEGRGGHLLKNTVAPAIICEPFFIDNDSDISTALEQFGTLAAAYAQAAIVWAKY